MFSNCWVTVGRIVVVDRDRGITYRVRVTTECGVVTLRVVRNVGLRDVVARDSVTKFVEIGVVTIGLTVLV
jgi:hypothetical protein